jgi:hypothetical protein
MADQKLDSNAMNLTDDRAWHDHSEIWLRRALRDTARRAKRERQRRPLILSGHGVSLRVEAGSLAIRNGFTHYPQKDGVCRLNPAMARCVVAMIAPPRFGR